MCAGTTAFSAIEKCALNKEEILAVIGLDALGHLAVQFAICMKLKIITTDNRQKPFELVQKFTGFDY